MQFTRKAFKASSEFIKIKVQFTRKASKGGFEVCRQKIVDHHLEWDLSFLNDEVDLPITSEPEVVKEPPITMVTNEAPAQAVEVPDQPIDVAPSTLAAPPI